MFEKEDEGTRIGLFTALGVVLVIVFGLVGGLALRHVHGKSAKSGAPAVAAAPAAAATPAAPASAAAPAEAASGAEAAASAGTAAAAAETLLDGPAAGTVVGTLYFGSGAAAMPADGAAAVAAALKALADNPGKKLVLSGYHDASGDPAKNAELAKLRAFAVRDALKAAGADAARVALRKPESTTGGGDAKEARRVDIRLVD